MKFWFTFGFGLVLGVMLGSFLTGFFLYDDIHEKQSAPLPIAAAAVSKKQPKKADSYKAVFTPPVEERAKPSAIPAEAVDLDSLPSIDGPEVIATAKRDDDSADIPRP